MHNLHVQGKKSLLPANKDIVHTYPDIFDNGDFSPPFLPHVDMNTAFSVTENETVYENALRTVENGCLSYSCGRVQTKNSEYGDFKGS